VNRLQPWALPASIALLALSTLVGSVIIAVPLQGIVLRLERPIQVEASGKLWLESNYGLGR
jgi:hypothetical protein